MTALLIFSKLLPVILLILLGYILKKTGIITDTGTDIIKKLIVDVGLPAVLFLSFLNITLDISFIFIIAGMFLLNVLLLVFGKAAGKINKQNKYTPFLFTGFEYGMFALGVFGAAYGENAISYIAVMDLGHELFIWFVFVTVLTAVSGQKKSLGETFGSFFKSPIIAGILLGLIGNAIGLEELMDSSSYFQGIKTTIEMVGNLTAPLILITIGAGLYFSRNGLKFAFITLAVRIPVVLLLFFSLGALLKKGFALPFAFEAALYTLLIAPPPFIIPLFIPKEAKSERGEINAVLTLYTLASLVLFIIFFALHPEL